MGPCPTMRSHYLESPVSSKLEQGHHQPLATLCTAQRGEKLRVQLQAPGNLSSQLQAVTE